MDGSVYGVFMGADQIGVYHSTRTGQKGSGVQDGGGGGGLVGEGSRVHQALISSSRTWQRRWG